MNRAISTDTTAKLSRRGIFRGAGGLAAIAATVMPAAATAAPVGGNDALLTRLADELEVVQHRMRAIQDGCEDEWADDPEYVALDDRETEIFDALGKTPPETLAGYRAIARVIREDFKSYFGDPALDGPATRLTFAMIDYLLGPERDEQPTERTPGFRMAFEGDMKLVALADESERVWAAQLPLLGPAEDDPAVEAELRRLQDIILDMAGEAGQIRAKTRAGWHAKCRLALLHGGIESRDWAGTECYLATSLIEDLLSADEIDRIERIRAGDEVTA